MKPGDIIKTHWACWLWIHNDYFGDHENDEYFIQPNSLCLVLATKFAHNRSYVLVTGGKLGWIHDSNFSQIGLRKKTN